MNISHIRADGSRPQSMKGVKAPLTANRIRSEVTFGEVLQKEMRKIEKNNYSSVGSLSYLCAGKGRGK